MCGPKVSCFGFPKDPELCKKWVSAIKREDFSPNANSFVCELHFQTHDIERLTKFLIEETGEQLDVPLKHPRLVKERSVEIEKIVTRVSAFEEFLQRNKTSYSFPQIEKDKCFSVDLEVILSEQRLNSDWPNVKDDIENDTDLSLKCMGFAMHYYISKERERNNEDANVEIIKRIPIIRARLTNYRPLLQLKDVKANCYGKLIAVQGTVIKASPVGIRCTYMAFSCYVCKDVQVVKQNNGCYTPADKCQNQDCRCKTKLQPLHNSASTRTISWQSIKLQENECDMATIPQTLNCELTEDLIKACLPGEFITVIGIVKVRDPSDSYCGRNKENMFTLYLEAVSAFNNKNQQGGIERIIFNTEDYYTIKQIHSQQNLFRYLVHSLCPNIYGHEIVKAGLLLALFKGTESPTVRAESHVLLMGDPGLGKSQMLRACTNVSPRGVYVCGNTSTSSGLTVTMTRESGGEYSLEAGALILADQGCCCIDEFDKMPTQHASLLEAMEQQCISLAKAGMVCSIPTKPTILVAANPAGGHYNKAKTISENLKISSPMLSRFDLILILIDTSNEQIDRHLSRHVLALHSRSSSQVNHSHCSSDESGLARQDENSLRERLTLPNESFTPLQHNLFRKYIAYAQKYVKPQLSQSAKDVLKEFYLSMRQQFRNGESTPVTTRQLHSLVRLTQARAKSELREEAMERDALDVIEIMKHSLTDIFSNEAGVLDTTRSQLGTGVSKKNKVHKLLRILQNKSEIERKSVFTLNEIKGAANEMGITTDFSNVFDSLNIQGFILHKGQNHYKLNSAYL